MTIADVVKVHQYLNAGLPRVSRLSTVENCFDTVAIDEILDDTSYTI